ncbi:structural contituent of cuticle [Holotrichia oblita]|uniref:Structural contituent of cuticle n=1 Tax=Holotrichia oblita TaxID=644536 RepID=A0ACB9SXM4_HOLOL|nr:structural contituent of cuticle [Holotrichia oblita]
MVGQLEYRSSTTCHKRHQQDSNRGSYASPYDPDTYSYNYDVSNDETGDNKNKWEKRENNVVRGAYSIVEPDGSTRLVEYTADANGFRPIVTKLAASNPAGRFASTYTVPNSNIFRPSGLTYGNQQHFGANLNYDNYGRNTYPSNFYPNVPSYNGYYNRARFTGYNDNVSPAPYIPPLRQDRQPVPLLHTAYHGYDNLYH